MTLDWKYTLDWYIPFDEENEKEVKDIICSAILSDDVLRLDEAALSLNKFVTARADNPYGAAALIGMWLHDIFIHMATIAAWDSPAQDRLVALLLTLERLPAKTEHRCQPEWASFLSSGVFLRQIDEAADGTG